MLSVADMQRIADTGPWPGRALHIGRPMNTSDEGVLFRLASKMLEVLMQQVSMYCCIFVFSCRACLH